MPAVAHEPAAEREPPAEERRDKERHRAHRQRDPHRRQRERAFLLPHHLQAARYLRCRYSYSYSQYSETNSQYIHYSHSEYPLRGI
jgi:hypothetical protein